jgi:hypothetical protein
MKDDDDKLNSLVPDNKPGVRCGARLVFFKLKFNNPCYTNYI